MTLAVIVIGIAGFLTLAMRRAPLWQWALGLAVLGFLTRFGWDGTTFGIISSTTDPFCSTCDRSRLTADGMWYLCLYATRGLDLRAPLRQGASAEELAALIGGGWGARDDRGAEVRLALGERRAFVPVQDLLRRDPHLEMHTRGG